MKRKKIHITKKGNVIISEKNISTPFSNEEKYKIGFEKKMRVPSPKPLKNKYNRKKQKKDWKNQSF